MDDRRALVDYDRGAGIWGVREFLPELCHDVTRMRGRAGREEGDVHELRAGLKAEAPFWGAPRAGGAGPTIAPTAPRCRPPGAMPTWCWDRCRGRHGDDLRSSVDVLLWIRVLGFGRAPDRLAAHSLWTACGGQPLTELCVTRRRPIRPLGGSSMTSVLVVEDDALLAYTLAGNLRDAGLSVIAPHQPRRRQALLADNKIDVACLDVRLGETETPCPCA